MSFNFFRLVAREVMPQVIVDVQSGDVSLQLLDEESGEVLDQSEGSDALRVSGEFGLSPSWFKSALGGGKRSQNRRASW